MNRIAFQTLIDHFEEKAANGTEPISGKMLTRLNILMGATYSKREDRIAALERMFGRNLKSSAHLTMGEGMAFLRAAYPQGGIVPAQSFVQFIQGESHELRSAPEPRREPEPEYEPF